MEIFKDLLGAENKPNSVSLSKRRLRVYCDEEKQPRTQAEDYHELHFRQSASQVVLNRISLGLELLRVVFTQFSLLRSVSLMLHPFTH